MSYPARLRPSPISSVTAPACVTCRQFDAWARARSAAGAVAAHCPRVGHPCRLVVVGQNMRPAQACTAGGTRGSLHPAPAADARPGPSPHDLVSCLARPAVNAHAAGPYHPPRPRDGQRPLGPLRHSHSAGDLHRAQLSRSLARGRLGGRELDRCLPGWRAGDAAAAPGAGHTCPPSRLRQSCHRERHAPRAYLPAKRDGCL
mmetsp:Transcript_14914/g.34741  ORF Transcript_14914/g.34741 Transcript_14914/m.34741 type:complete len:202 (+) Transcript_14914:2553-3158(+)